MAQTLKLSQLNPKEIETVPSNNAPLKLSQIDLSEVHAAPSSDQASTQSVKAPGVAQTALEHYANGLTLGYLPQLQAVAEDPIFYALNKITGQNVEPDSYVNARDQNIERLGQEAKANPKTAVGSELAGALTGAAIMPSSEALEAKGLVGGAVKGAAIGAGYGALSNPGDVKGVVNPFQIDERVSNAEKGTLIGGATGLATQGIAKGLKSLGNSARTLRTHANAQAVKATGAMLKDFRALNGTNRTQILGEFALDNGLVKAGDTFEDVGAKADALKNDAGKRLDALYSQAKKAIPSANHDISSRFSEMPESEFKQFKNLGFNPGRDKSKILGLISKDLGDHPDRKAALRTISNYLDDLNEKYGHQVLDPKKANDIEAEISKKINFLRNPLNPEPAKEQAFKTLRSFISNKVDQHISFLSKYMDDPKAAEKLAKANRDYGFSKQIAQMAKDKAQRFMANRHISLTDTIAGGGGAAVGALIGEKMGGPGDATEGGLLGLAGAAALNHFGRSYGDAVLSTALNRAADVAEMGPSQIGKLASNVVNPKTANQLTKAISENELSHYGQGSKFEAPNQDQNNPVPLLQSRASSPQTASIKKTGPAKWANDGFNKLLIHSKSNDEKETLKKIKGAMLNSKEGKRLLIAASDLKPGSKAMQKIMDKIKQKFEAQK